MSLKINHPTYAIKIPSLDKKVAFKPMLLKEEKILLTAKENKNEDDVLAAVKQIIALCCTDSSIDIEKLSVFDIDYIFIKIMQSSVNNIVKLQYKDLEDNQEYKFEVDLSSIEIDMSKKSENLVPYADGYSIELKYPTASIYGVKDSIEDYDQKIILSCIKKVFKDDEVITFDVFSKEEMKNFYENMTIPLRDKILEFIESMPRVVHVIKYKNKMGTERAITLSSLNDFFMLY